MHRLFLIKYVVDTGYEYLRDEAIVPAIDENIAIECLKNVIAKLGCDYWMHEVLSVEEFKGNVFTRQYGAKSFC